MLAMNKPLCIDGFIKTKTLPDNCPLEEDKYYELLYAVETKYPNESRHETALRYIKEAETPSDSSEVKEECGSVK